MGTYGRLWTGRVGRASVIDPARPVCLVRSLPIHSLSFQTLTLLVGFDATFTLILQIRSGN